MDCLFGYLYNWFRELVQFSIIDFAPGIGLSDRYAT